MFNVDERILEFFNKKFNDNSIVTDEARKVIMDLYEKGYKIILFSNSSCLVNSCIDYELSKYIDHIYYSYDIGYTKEDREAYQIIISDLLVAPNEILHIGDTYISDYLIPKENGFRVLFYGKNDEVTDNVDKLSDIYNYL